MVSLALTIIAGLQALTVSGQHHWHHHRPCGCSWSNQGACGISTKQILNSLNKSKIDEMCAETRNQGDDSKTDEALKGNLSLMSRAKMITRYECYNRGTIKSKLPGYKKCEGLEPSKCTATKQCQMGAQSTGNCGIDEEHLILDLVGPNHTEHPLVKVVNASNQCKEKSEKYCEADSSCGWMWHHCDMKEEFFYNLALANPQLLLLLELLEVNSQCHFFDEAFGICHSPCQYEAGICRYNASRLPEFRKMDTKELVRVMCKPKGNETSCASPCHRVGSECHAPAELETMSHHHLGRSDWHIFGLMLQLESSTAMIERRCNVFDSNESRCAQHAEQCSVEHFQSWTTTMTTTTRYQGPSTTYVPTTTRHGYTPETTVTDAPSIGIGADGTLGRLIGSVRSGEFAEKLNQFVENNPETISELRKNLDKGLEELAKDPPKLADDEDEDADDDDEGKTLLDEPMAMIVGAFLLFGCGLAMMSWSCGMVCGRSYHRSGGLLLPQEQGSTADYERGGVQ